MDYELFTNLTNISYAFIIAGLLVVLLTVGSSNEGAVIATISGYSASACAILLLTGLTYTNITSTQWPGIFKILNILTPFIILLVIFGLSIALVSKYFDRIVNNRVSQYYNLFSFMSVVFIFIQIMLFFSSIKEVEFKERGIIKPLTISKLILLGLINVIILISLGVSLKYSSTDG
jgi:uncharacterized membrane protein